MIEIKPGVTLGTLRPQMLIALHVMEALYDSEGVSCVITSGDDGKHKRGSRHYDGHALDFRTHTLKKGRAQRIVELASLALGSNYTVLLEDTHIHVQYNASASTTRQYSQEA